MAAFDEARLSDLFRERARLSDELAPAQAEAKTLMLEHNLLVREANQAVTPGGRQRASLKASHKGEESKRAQARAEQLSRQLQQKEIEIADMIAALLAATKPLLSGDSIRQLNEHLTTIGTHLQHIDENLRPIASAFGALRAAIEGQAEFLQRAETRQETRINTVLTAADAAEGSLAQIHRELSQQSRSLQMIRSSVAGETDRPTGPPVVQLGWRPGTPEVTEPRSPQLPAETAAALPEKVTVLLFASEPRDQPRTDLDKEIREILTRIGEAEFGHRITLQPWLAAQAFDLVPNCNRYKPHMVQFSGHGTADGYLTMGPRDRSEPVAAGRLIQMLSWAGEDLRIVFFNICDSEEHARAAAQLIDGAVGMRGKMHDAPARAFAAHLYSGLAFGHSLKSAFHQACATIGDEPDSAVPQLFFRNGRDPHKVVLVRPDRSR